MSGPRWKQNLLLALAALVVVASGALGRVLWQDAALRTIEATGATRADLVARTIRATIAENEHFPLVMALDPDVQAALAAPRDATRVDALNRKLEAINAASSPAALYVMRADGGTLAASNWNTGDSFVGHYYGFRSYFTEAMSTGVGSYFGIGVTTGRAGYFLSRAVGQDPITGVAVAKIEFDALEATWAQSYEEIMVADANGIVFLSGRPEWKYHALGPIEDIAFSRIEQTQQYAGTEIAPLPFAFLSADKSEMWVEGLPEDRTYLHQTVAIGELGWTVHQLTDLAPVSDARRDGTIIGASGSALLIAILFYLAQRQRSFATERRARAELEKRVTERTRELRTANESLQLEIEERRRTEHELRTTQNDLVQAGKLAALGQMSAAIAHEINQPLTAMRTYIATTRIFVPLGDPKAVIDNLDKVDNLVVRMGRITSHLKTFARKEGMEPPEPISASRAVLRAIDLVDVQARTAGIAIEQDISPAWTMGNEVRLEQVVLNLVRNAMDAVAELDTPRITVRVETEGDRVRIGVADNGPGFTPEILGTLFDPFVTTKPSGAGLGLGLTISYEIVREFGGTLQALNRPEGGALLLVELAACPAPARTQAVSMDA